MTSYLKVNIAVLLCSVFVFRIVSLNICLGSNSFPTQNFQLVKSFYSSAIKRSKQLDTTTNQFSFENSVAELSEEEVEEGHALKSHSHDIVQFIFAYFSGKTAAKILFHPSTSNQILVSSADRLLFFQIFRI